MKGLNAILKRELLGYFTTPVAYVFLAVFLLASNAFAFYLGNLYERGQASLEPFFQFHPWLYVFLVPAVSMRLWAEERRSGTIELLMSMPVPLWQFVLGKFLAAWVFILIGLALTFPIWISVSYLGNPDQGLILSGYWGSAMLAGAYLSMGAFVSSCTKNQVIAFVVSAALCFLFTIAGYPMVIGFFQVWLPQAAVEFISRFNFLTHFSDMQRGVIEYASVFYFCSLMVFWLYLTHVHLKTGAR